MKTKAALFCFTVIFVFLTACHGGYSAPSALIPSAAPSSRTPAAESALPATEPVASAEESQVPAMSLAEYCAMVSAFNTKIMDESEILMRIGLFEYNWWGGEPENPADVDMDVMFEAMLEWLFEDLNSTMDTIAAARQELLADYVAIAYANVDGEIPAELSGLVNELFSAYYQLYAMVTEPSGALWDFVPMLCSCTHSITMANVELTRALDSRPDFLLQPEVEYEGVL